MKSLIICTSVAHGNTRRVADMIAGELDATVVTPDEVDPYELAEADLIGFGSGVYYQKLHRGLTDFVRQMPAGKGRAFVFATSGFTTAPWKPLLPVLEGKGYAVAGTFRCPALDTWGPFKLMGGVNKHHPNRDDLEAARAFARGLRHS